VLFGIASPVHRDLGSGGFDAPEVFGGQFHGHRPEVLVQAVELRGARNRDDPRLLGEEPRERDLGSRGIIAGCDMAEQLDD
jgi:hypothetical protein